MSKKIPNMPQRILLLITVGAQDLKVWKRSENAPEADRLSTPDLRDKHLKIRNNPDAWTVLTAADTRKPESTGVIPLENAEELARALGCATPLFSGDGRLCLSVAKIEPILEGIIAHPDLKVAGALLFYTERLEENGEGKTEDRDYRNEPIASAHVAARYLRDRLKFHDGLVNTVNWMEGLAGRFEGGLGENDDFPLRREIVAIVDRAMHEFLSSDESLTDADIMPVTMTTGGADAFKQLLPALAELRFRARVRDLSAPETRSANAPAWENLVSERLCARHPRITRHEAIAARGRALELVRMGDPVSAWAAVHRYAGSELDEWWLAPLSAVAEYFGGAGFGVATSLESISSASGNNEAARQLKDALREVQLDVEDEFVRHQRFALNAAMRVELALQGPSSESRRYAEALSAVCTLVDAAVIARAIQFNPDRLLYWIQENPTQERNFFDKGKQGKKGLPTGTRDYWFGRAKEIKACNELAKALQDHFVALIELDDALQFQRKGVSLRKLRNTASHRSLSPSDIKLIAELAECGVSLWNTPGDRKLGHQALGLVEAAKNGNRIAAALQSIEIGEPMQCYIDVMQRLEDILLTCEPGPKRLP